MTVEYRTQVHSKALGAHGGITHILQQRSQDIDLRALRGIRLILRIEEVDYGLDAVFAHLREQILNGFDCVLNALTVGRGRVGASVVEHVVTAAVHEDRKSTRLNSSHSSI